MTRIAADFTEAVAGDTIAGQVAMNRQSGWADALDVILSLLTWFSRNKSSKYALGGGRARNFKEQFKSKLTAWIESQSIEDQMRQSVETYVRECFEGLKETVSRDVEALIGNSRRTLKS